MTNPVRWLLSLLFIAQMYLAMLVLAVVYLVPALVSRSGAWAGVHAYCRWVRFTARILVGLRSEIRGEVPQGEVLIASKHQSFFDIILICSAVPRPKFIMKKELKWAPLLGWYALRIGCIPVDRGKKGRAIAEMKRAVAEGAKIPGQLIIYPQGTRVAPGATLPYKVGTGIIYAQMNRPCVPAATNVGVFWPRHGILRKPGLAVVEFLPAIAPGRSISEFMAEIEAVIEPASDRLMQEAGFVAAG
ncbi:lysophospholipid acyltransferase family protein [Paragemmobacter straminiformis]|uniref:1-acyl-sn-glycerol-3-phosphate acyltransferase n=1 Tax=Paragemmobacter straminiformis TaxID=2045119 RepID=A0A842I5I9_9RHOB|nr:lysophospholipid acyltransferase family protein [Gemmobacter straminiformis]MBC2834906.1 1-acyl-sn-glycerol-3-phosphate acyltransferase [Gemmobacter straminiformis]